VSSGDVVMNWLNRGACPSPWLDHGEPTNVIDTPGATGDSRRRGYAWQS